MAVCKTAGALPLVSSNLTVDSSFWVVSSVVEQLAFNQLVEGSSPSRPTNHGMVAQMVEQPPLKRQRVGSSPTRPTMLCCLAHAPGTCVGEPGLFTATPDSNFLCYQPPLLSLWLWRDILPCPNLLRCLAHARGLHHAMPSAISGMVRFAARFGVVVAQW